MGTKAEPRAQPVRGVWTGLSAVSGRAAPGRSVDPRWTRASRRDGLTGLAHLYGVIHGLASAGAAAPARGLQIMAASQRSRLERTGIPADSSSGCAQSGCKELARASCRDNNRLGPSN